MKLFFLLFFFFSFANCTDTLIDALTQGTFTKKIDLAPTKGEGFDNEIRNQKVIFHYVSAPLNGMQVEVKNDGLNAYAKALYNGEFSDFDYILSIKNDIENTQTYAVDISYNLSRELSLGTRYSVKDTSSEIVSYSGVYSSIILDEISKGLNVDLSFHKKGLDDNTEQFKLKIQSPF